MPTAYQRALRRLSRRDHSEGEMRMVLRDRGHSPNEIEAAIAQLLDRGFLNDRAFAERFARSRIGGRGLGRLRVTQALRQRGIPRTVAESGLQAALQEVSEGEALEALARRYWRMRERDEPSLRIRKLWVFLLRRGYPSSLVGERLRALWPRWQDALEGLDPVDETA